MIDPNEADGNGFGPQLGSPILHLPDGRRIAVSRWEEPFLGLSFLSVMDFGQRFGGVWNWNCFGEPYEFWEADTPTPGVADDRVLSGMIERDGGPAGFIIRAMGHCSLEVAHYLDFNPAWSYGQQPAWQHLDEALTAWALKSVVPSMPALLVLPYPR